MQTIQQLLLQPDTGKKVLETLTKESGTSLPSQGLVAGQSVLSALFQLASDNKKVVYNDIDVFQFKKNEKMRNRVTGKNQTAVFHEVVDASEEYSQLYSGVVKFFNSTREGDINKITVKASSNVDFSSSEDHLKTFLLKTFDINSVKVGVDLKTEKIFWEQDFVNYLKTQQLHLSTVIGPVQSLLRILTKHEKNQGYLDFEYALNMTMASILSNFGGYTVYEEIAQETPQLLERSPLEAQLWLEKEYSVNQRIESVKKSWTENLKKYGYSTFKGPVFGKKYFDYYVEHEERLAPYFELVKLENGTRAIYYPLIKKLPDSFTSKIKPFETLLTREWNSTNVQKSKNKRQWLVSYEKILNPSTKQSEKENILRLINTPPEFVEGMLVKGYSLKKFSDSMNKILTPGAYSEKTKEKLISYYRSHSNELRKSLWSCTSVSEIHEKLNQSFKSITSVWGEDNINKAFAAHHKYSSVIKEVTRILQYENQPLRERLKQEKPNFTLSLQLREVNDKYVYVAQSKSRGYTGQSSKEVYVAEDQEEAFQKFVVHQNLLMNKDYMTLLKSVHMLNFSIESSTKKRALQPVWEKDEVLFEKRVNEEFGGNSKFKVTQLRTEFELEQEGEEMSHCVGGYSTTVAQGLCSIWHLQEEGTQNHSTLEVRLKEELITIDDEPCEVSKYYIVQNRARHNKTPVSSLLKLGNILVDCLNSKNKKSLQKRDI